MARVAAVKHALAGTLLVVLAALSVALPATPAQARARTEGASAAVVRVAELPRQGQETYGLIRQGGPFPYGKDGVVFGNRERILPPNKRGYYREYTVPTPGAGDRGARRIVCGGPARVPEACWYTADHYASFRLIVE